MRLVCALALALAIVDAAGAAAQTFAQRGYAEGAVLLYPQQAPADPTRAVADLLVREEAFARPRPWLQVAAGVDFRVNSHDQVTSEWAPDWSDRGIERPRVSIRRMSATFTRGPITIDAGKQFIRWGTTDIVTPTDRFAPRDFLNVITSEFLPVLGARGSYRWRDETLEGVWVPRLTPSRVPLFTQRWTVIPEEAAGLLVEDRGLDIPDGSQVGARWRHVGSAFETALSFFDGFNHLPNIAAVITPAIPGGPPSISLTREYPAIRAYGVDGAVPTRWLTLKAEAAYFDNRSHSDLMRPFQGRPDESDDYVLYVIQLERQTGEWVIVGGYAGEVVTTRRAAIVFSPDRGLARSIVGRASYTIDPRRSVAIEGTVRQGGDGIYGKVEYSETRGQHWRVTAGAVVIAGHSDDFLGQFRRNGHASLALRYSF